MNEREGINTLNFLPTGINRDDPVIQAFISDYNGDGSFALEVEEVCRFIDYFTKTDNVKKHKSYTLEMIVKMFTKLKRQIVEPDNVLLRRMLSLTERKGDLIWGNALNMIHVFETYFTNINAYICENTGKDNKLSDGDFETDDVWHLGGSASFSEAARFSEKRGLFFDGITNSFCKQTVKGLVPAVYTLHFFLSGTCAVIIKNENGKYYCADEKKLYRIDEKEVHNSIWSDSVVINHFSSPKWDDVSFFIVMGEKDGNTLEIEFINSEDEAASIDYARLFIKPANPTYTITVQYTGYSISPKTLHLGIGESDPVPQIDYEKESYFDHSYVIGRKGSYPGGVYNKILDMVRPVGIEAFFEVVEKAEETEQEK